MQPAILCLISASLGIYLSTFETGPQSLSLSDLKMIRWLLTAKAGHDHEPWPNVPITITMTLPTLKTVTMTLTSGTASQCWAWPLWPPPPSESLSTGWKLPGGLWRISQGAKKFWPRGVFYKNLSPGLKKFLRRDGLLGKDSPRSRWITIWMWEHKIILSKPTMVPQNGAMVMKMIMTPGLTS